MLVRRICIWPYKDVNKRLKLSRFNLNVENLDLLKIKSYKITLTTKLVLWTQKCTYVLTTHSKHLMTFSWDVKFRHLVRDRISWFRIYKLCEKISNLTITIERFLLYDYWIISELWQSLSDIRYLYQTRESVQSVDI